METLPLFFLLFIPSRKKAKRKTAKVLRKKGFKVSRKKVSVLDFKKKRGLFDVGLNLKTKQRSVKNCSPVKILKSAQQYMNLVPAYIFCMRGNYSSEVIWDFLGFLGIFSWIFGLFLGISMDFWAFFGNFWDFS